MKSDHELLVYAKTSQLKVLTKRVFTRDPK